MREIAKVTGVSGSDVLLELDRTDACANCRSCIRFGDSKMKLTATNLCDAKTNDEVVVELDDTVFIKAALIVYGIPLVFLVAGFFIGELLDNFILKTNNDILSFIIGLSLMFVSFVLIKLSENTIRANKFKPKAIEIYIEEEI